MFFHYSVISSPNNFNLFIFYHSNTNSVDDNNNGNMVIKEYGYCILETNTEVGFEETHYTSELCLLDKT